MNSSLKTVLPLLLLGVTGSLAAQTERDLPASGPRPVSHGRPSELHLTKAGSTTLDLRQLPQVPLRRRGRPEREAPEPNPVELPGGSVRSVPVVPGPSAPAPPPDRNFAGLDFATWGAGHPPDTNGDVGPNHYIQAINTAIGVFSKSDGAQIAAFAFDTLMSQGSFGNLCDTDNYGDPVVLYDTFEDRWVISDFAFQLDVSGNVVNPPGAFQCFAVSKTADPVSGGWNFYSINTAGGLGDYPKFGIWPDGLYMSVNMFGYAASSSFQGARVYALNKAQMYAGSSTVQVVSFDAPSGDFALLPSNARLQTGTPPAGAPNYFISTWQFLNAVTVYKFHVDWDHIATSTFTGPDTPLAASSWPNASVPNAPSLGGNPLDVLQIRAMMQNQYTHIGGVESLWTAHTVRRGDTTGFAAPRWYQVNVTGGAVAGSIPQAATWDPDGANVIHRFMPSLAVDRVGDMALGYSTSDATTKPAIKYAGRLSSDPANTLGQTEQVLIQGTGTQTGTCGGTCSRWGDYSAMTLDPDGCTFWYTNEYYAVDGLNHQTRIGSFAFPTCTPTSSGTLNGTVTATAGGAAISGATVALGSRTTTTDAAGGYQFSGLPAGTYPVLAASAAGFVTSATASVVVTGGATATQDFSLATAAASACPVDTAQSDFQAGVPTNLDLTTAPGAVTLASATVANPVHAGGTSTGTSFATTSWGGQTFLAGVTGPVVRAEVQLFGTVTGTPPSITVSLRATSAGLPTGADLATATLPGFTSGSGTWYTVSFASPAALTAGTTYALILRPATNPSAGGYFWIRSSPGGYADGQRVLSSDGGTTWSADATRDFNFRIYVDAGYAASGSLVSSRKDANPSPGFTLSWSTLSWAGATPAGATLRFQVAASNSAAGPFSFVGPDGTPATFFTTSGASLSQFDGKRYLEYQALLSTTDSTLTPTLYDVTVCFSNTAPPPPDLSLTLSDGGASVAPGGVVAYTLSFANSASQGATGVVLTETVPANTTFDSGASSPGWVCAPNDNAGSTCTLALGAVAAGAGSASRTFAVSVASPLAAGVTQIANTASIADDGANGADPTPANNVASDTTPVLGAPDLSITKNDGGVLAVPGLTLTYTLTYENTGNRNASGVVLSDTVPAHTTFSAAASNPGWACVPSSAAGSTCSLSIGALAGGGGSQSATFVVSVDNPLPGSVTEISNTATIGDDGANGTDPTPGNNAATATTTVQSGFFYALSPCRLLDTRGPDGPYGGPAVTGQSSRTFVAAGRCGVPAGAKAVQLNIAVTGGTAAGDLRLYPADVEKPLTAAINYAAGQTRAANAIIPLGAAGDFVVFSDQGSGTVHVVIDVFGYFQ